MGFSLANAEILKLGRPIYNADFFGADMFDRFSFFLPLSYKIEVK